MNAYARARADIAGMSRDALGAWYARAVGYDPFADDPTQSTETVRRIATEFVNELETHHESI